MKYKSKTKAISLIVSLLLLMQVVPISAFADEATLNDESKHITLDESFVEDDLEIVCELEDSRTEYSKEFLLSDGSYYSIITAYPMHIMKNGEWENASEGLNSVTSLCNVDDVKNTIMANSQKFFELEDELLSTAPMSRSLSVTENNEMLNDSYQDSNGNNKIIFNNIYNTTLSTLTEEENIADIYEFTEIDSAMQITISPLNSYLDENKAIKSAKMLFSRHAEDCVDETTVGAQIMFYEGNQNATDGLVTSDSIGYLNLFDSYRVDSIGNYEVNITDTMHKWDIRTLDNHGIVVRAILDEWNFFTLYNFAFEVYYDSIDKDDLDYTYHSINMGSAGNAYVNNYTNAFWLENTLFELDSRILPITLSRIVDGNSPITSNCAGLGFSWNIESTISIVLNDTDETTRNNTATWHSFNGETILFEPDESNPIEGEYVIWRELNRASIQDNTSINLYILKNELESGNINFANIYLKQGDTTYHFNESGRVVSVERPKANDEIAEVTISYDTNKVDTLTDENGVSYKFTYSTPTGYRVKYINNIKIENSETNLFNFSLEKISIEGTSYNKNTVTFSTGETVSYIFNSTGKLFRVINGNSECWEFAYSNKPSGANQVSTKRLSGYTKYTIDENGNYNEEYTVSFIVTNGYYREIIKTQGEESLKEILQYDRNQRIITHKDFSGKYICVEYDDNGIVSSYAFSDEDAEEKLNDPSFELESIGQGNTWSFNENTSCEIVESSYGGSSHGVKELKLSSDSESTMTITQTVTGSFLKDNTYIVGAWVKVIDAISGDGRDIGIEVRNNNGDLMAFAEFDNSLVNEWQYRLIAFNPQSPCSSIDVALTAKNQKGEVRFDEITLFDATDSQYDLNNIVTSSPINVNYNEDGTISSETLTNGIYSMSQAYVYDNSGKIIETTDINGLTKYYKYSSLGKWVGTVKADDGEIEDATQLTYNSYGVLQTVTQTINAVTNGRNKTLQTIYGTEYGKISSVYHGGIEYSFEYNPNGTIRTIDVTPSVGSDNSALIEYEYTGTSNIGYIIYKNGYEVDYTYDSNGNICLVECYTINAETEEANLIKTYEYTYVNGKLATSYDSKTGYTIVYSDSGYSYNMVRENETEPIELYRKITNENGETVETFRQAYHNGENNNGEDTIITSESTNSVDSSTGNVTNMSSVSISKNASDNKLSTMNYSKSSVTDYFNRIINKETALVYETGKGKTYNVVSETNYEYQILDVGITSGLISEYTTTISGDNANSSAGMSEYESYSRKYEYDHKGNVKYVYVQNGTTVTPKEYYEYDEANQLVTSIDFSRGKVEQYTYDSSGNLASKVYYNYANLDFNHDERAIISLGTSTKSETFLHNSSTIQYTYPDTNGQSVTSTIELDEMGNPKNYVGIDVDNAIVTGTLEWNGNLLTKFENSNHRIEYEYDLNGYRSTKTVYDVKTGNGIDPMYKMTYIWDNGVLTNLIYKGGDSEELSLNIIYDQEGSPVGYITSMGLPYYFIKDVNENVIGLVHADGTLMYSISYDAWGTPYYSYHGSNILEDLIIKATAIFNPITYHGYIYDYETGMYCSQGRCYSPTWGRYLNPESPTALLEYSENVLDANLYLFCNNNPVNNIDPYAMWSRDCVEIGWNARGFNVAINDMFASRSFCSIFANQFLKEYGSWDAINGYNYLGMDNLRIASDLFAHYIGKNSPAAINKTNAIWGEGWLQNAEDIDIITIKYNDKNAWKYEKIWYAAPEIKAYAWSEGVFITL